MSITQLLFTARGRINRAKYWLTVLIYIAAWAVVLGLLWTASFTNQLSVGMWALLAVLFAVVLVSSVMVAVKRLHDRDKSGWWLLLFYVLPTVLEGMDRGVRGAAGFPILSLIGLAISIWAIVELGFLRGTPGPNQYGPDPLQKAA